MITRGTCLWGSELVLKCGRKIVKGIQGAEKLPGDSLLFGHHGRKVWFGPHPSKMEVSGQEPGNLYGSHSNMTTHQTNISIN